VELPGVFGVVGALIFDGLQLEQTPAIGMAETYQNRTAATIDTNVGILTGPAAFSGLFSLAGTLEQESG
jgi:hypothetical protein